MASTWASGLTLPSSSEHAFRTDTGFTFIDFLPECREPGGIFSAPVYDTFRTLIDRANDWLRANKGWKITTCESVEFRAKGQHADSNKMTYIEYGESMMRYIRGLRLWLTERKNGDEREQQIGFLNLIPRQLEESRMFHNPKFETLDDVIGRFNSTLQTNPLPGRIINVESQEMKMSNFQNFEPDRSGWTERGDFLKHFLFIIRIFYEVMSGSSEEIGIQDFLPDKVRDGGIFSLPDYEPFSEVVKKASEWYSKQNGLRFCNAQSLEIKLKRGKDINTQKMDFVEHGNVATYYVRILRVVYTKPPGNHFMSDEPSSIRQLTCRTFVPVQLTTSIFAPKYETLLETRQRVSAWLKATGAHVLSAETAALRIITGGERKHGTEATFTYNAAERNEYWMFVIRLYLNGAYKEPPLEMLPPMPELKTQDCCVTS